MRKHGGTSSRRDKHVMLTAISPPGVDQGHFVEGQQSGQAGCKPPPLFMRGASCCLSQGPHQGEPRGASPRPSAPTYLPYLCVSLSVRSACSLPILAGVCSVCVCVFGLGFRLRPPTPGWGVGVCVCLCARSAYTPPLLAGVCGVGVGAWARFWAAPRHSRLGCWGVCVFVCALRLYPATPCWAVRACVGALARVSAEFRHSWLGCWGVCLCLCACSTYTRPLLALVCGVGVCIWARALTAPRHSWPGCWGVCVFVCALRL